MFEEGVELEVEGVEEVSILRSGWTRRPVMQCAISVVKKERWSHGR